MSQHQKNRRAPLSLGTHNNKPGHVGRPRKMSTDASQNGNSDAFSSQHHQQQYQHQKHSNKAPADAKPAKENAQQQRAKKQEAAAAAVAAANAATLPIIILDDDDVPLPAKAPVPAVTPAQTPVVAVVAPAAAPSKAERREKQAKQQQQLTSSPSKALSNGKTDPPATAVPSAIDEPIAVDPPAAVAVQPAGTPEKRTSKRLDRQSEIGTPIKDASAVLNSPAKATVANGMHSTSDAPLVESNADPVVVLPVQQEQQATGDVEQMETLQMEDEDAAAGEQQSAKIADQSPNGDQSGSAPADSPQRSASKVLKYSQSPAAAASAAVANVAARSRLSPYAARRSLENVAAATAASEHVNLSTVSEQSNECSPAVTASATDGGSKLAGMERPLISSLRQITGRRSTRPLREIAMQQSGSGSVRETYRRTRTELDDSVSSMNVTVGSVIGQSVDDDDAPPNDADGRPSSLVAALGTPLAALKGRKRVAPLTGSEPDLVSVGLQATESPKKARLDMSGFFGLMASPVTLLRNKFSRTSLLCSTPNATKKLNVDAPENDADATNGGDDDSPLPLADELPVTDDQQQPADEPAEMKAVDDLPPETVLTQVDADDVSMIEADALKPSDQTDLNAEIAVELTTIEADAKYDEVATGDILVGRESPEPEIVVKQKPAKKSTCLVM